MSEIKSGRFSIKVDRVTNNTQTGTNGKTSEVIVYKGLNLLTPVNVTPSENQYRVTLSCTGCTAELKNDYKTIYVKNVTASSAKIDVTINVENKVNYKKTISIEKVISENEISNMKSNISVIEQKADSISLRVEQTEENLSNNYPTYNKMYSAIDMKADKIISTVSKTYTTKDDFNNLNIGSRNMLLKTSDYKILSCNGSENQSFFLYNISDPSLLAGKTATLTFTYKVKNWNGQGGFTPQTGDSNYIWFNQFWLWSEGKFEYSATTSFPSNFNDTKFYIRSDWIYGTIEVTEARLVVSDKKADWSPAPEDVENRMSTLEQTAETLTAKFTDGYTMGIIEQSINGIKVKHSSIDSNSYTHMSATGFYLKNKGTDVFRVDGNGLYVKGNGDFTGNVTANSGFIGGFYIYNGRLVGYGGKGVGISGDATDWAFWAGSNTGGDAPFHVSHDGWVYASNATITGTITSSTIEGGTITGSTISGNTISGGTISGTTVSGSIFKSGTDYNPHKQNITGLQMQDDTIYSYGTKNNGIYAVTKISGGTINIGNGEDGAGLGWSTHISSSDISLFKQGVSGYFYVGATEAPGSGYSTTTTTIDTTTINIGSKDVTTAFKVDYNGNCEFGNNYFTRGSLTINQLSKGVAKGTQTYLTGTTISATTIYQNGSSVSGSDIILKDNIKEYEGSALDIIDKTKVYSFNRILANPDKTEIGFLAQQVPDIFVFDKGEFTAEELEGLTAQEKQQLLAKKTEEHRAVLENKKLDEIADKIVSFYDLSDEQTEEQISQIIDEYKNIEYEVPISTINQNNIIAIMFKAIQELKAELDELKKSLSE